MLERWTVPTMLKPEDLARLQAAACLTIAEDGTLRAFRIVESSGNALFDGSLNATLGSIKTLPKPHWTVRFCRQSGRSVRCFRSSDNGVAARCADPTVSGSMDRSYAVKEHESLCGEKADREDK